MPGAFFAGAFVVPLSYHRNEAFELTAAVSYLNFKNMGPTAMLTDILDHIYL